MKNRTSFLVIFLFISLSLFSCNTSKEIIAQRKADIQQSKERDASCFVQMNDGTLKKFSTLKLVTGIFKYPYLLADGKMKIRAGEIKAYQDQHCYAISQAGIVSGHRTCVAKETLPGFAVRIAKGKINVYVKKYFNGSKEIDEYFVQQGDDGKILPYTTEIMNRMIENDPEVLDFFLSKKYNTPKTNRSHQVALNGHQESIVSYQFAAQPSVRAN